MVAADAMDSHAHEARMAALLQADLMPQRAAIFAEGGPLAAVMRANEAREWVPGWLREVWLWVLWLRVVRGLRGTTTVASYAAILGRYCDWSRSVDGIDYAAIRLEQLDAWLKSLFVVRRNSAASRRQQIQALRSFYDWRKTRGLGPNCTDGLIGPRMTTKTPRKYSREQLRALFHAAKLDKFPLTAQRNRMLILLLLSTGLRREETSGLRCEQLDLDKNTGVVRVLGKGAKEREIPIEGPVVRELIEWIALRGEIDGLQTDCLFFTTRQNWFGHAMRPRAIERVIGSVARRAGLSSWGVHRFRVTFATQLYDDGADIERIRLVMGHETIETTRRYLAVSQRMRDVRLKPHRQHDALGTKPVGFPKWAARMEGKAPGGDA